MLHKQANSFFYAVYDGHGGTFVVKQLQQQLHYYLSNNSNFPNNIEVAIKESKRWHF